MILLLFKVHRLISALKKFALGSKTYRSVETVDPERPVKKNE